MEGSATLSITSITGFFVPSLRGGDTWRGTALRGGGHLEGDSIQRGGGHLEGDNIQRGGHLEGDNIKRRILEGTK